MKGTGRRRADGAAATPPSAWSACLLLALLALAMPAAAQVVPLESLPAALADTDEGKVLRIERNRLRGYLEGLQGVAAEFNARCLAVLRDSAAWHGCRSEQARLEDKRLAYNEDVRQFNARIEALRRRAVTGRPGEGLARADAVRKTELLLDALAFGAGDWQASLRYLHDLHRRDPNDDALRDALTYLEGMYRGHLAARDLANRYYRYGVQRWVAQDYDMAARAFARAARDDPDDLKIFRSFAYAVGRQHGGTECRATGVCVSTELPRWASFFGPDRELALAALEAEVGRNPSARELRDAVRFLEGMAVYAVGAPTPRPLNERAQALSSRAVGLVGRKDHVGAARLFAQALQAAEGDRALIYLRHYHEGVAAAEGRPDALPPQDLLLAEVHDQTMREVSRRRAPAPSEMAGRAARQALDALRSALAGTKGLNPFDGALDPAEIAALAGTRPP